MCHNILYAKKIDGLSKESPIEIGYSHIIVRKISAFCFEKRFAIIDDSFFRKSDALFLNQFEGITYLERENAGLNSCSFSVPIFALWFLQCSSKTSAS